MKWLWCIGLCVLLFPFRLAQAQADYNYSGAPVRQVIEDIQERSPYRFLYRDAVVAGKLVSFEARADEVIETFERSLRIHGLRLQIDESRKQILIILQEGSMRDGRDTLTGVVIDDDHGTRLPYATITWESGGRLRGAAANEAGTFQLQLSDFDVGATSVEMNFSYVGYRSKRIRIDLTDPPSRLPVRLSPETTFGPELVVSTASLQTELDTNWLHLLRPGIFSPLGESSVLRSLQTLPSVSISPAVSPGLNVRGSRADGFQVLLDGMSIYNQNHFFGLFDAFNEDALQTVGLYYAVTPASLQGPPGGTLSFVTRTGSQTAFRPSVGVSNTAGKATLEGPLFKGRGSWLLSGRRSYLNTFDWFNNGDLIALGLDVGRATSEPDVAGAAVAERALARGDARAHFYDVHGKLFYEWEGGQRLLLNAYLGGDHTMHDGLRQVQDPIQRRPVLEPVQTTNDWGNEAASLNFQLPLGSMAYSLSTLGFSRYRSEFSKVDFVYTDPVRNSAPMMDSVRHIVRPFRNENELMELKLAQQVDRAVTGSGTFSVGYALQRYRVEYREDSALRSSFGGEQSSTQLDLFTQFDARVLKRLDLQAGIRSHYFSQGKFLRLSPRLRLRVFPDRVLSAGIGFSHNHQFLHRLSVEQTSNADVWVMSSSRQPPGSVDHLSGGIYFTPSPGLFFQTEAYVKSFRNLREHEASAARRRLHPASVVLDPWLHNSEALAKGIEVMARTRFGPLLWTNSYTLSRMDLWNPRINNGEKFAADWDRRHQFTSHLQAALSSGIMAHVVWAYASGAPNDLAYLDATEPARLDAYHRMDLGLHFRTLMKGTVIEARLAAFNVYDRQNDWYRDPIAIVRRTPQGRQVGFTTVDVYDLGIQPSFELSVTF